MHRIFGINQGRQVDALERAANQGPLAVAAQGVERCLTVNSTESVIMAWRIRWVTIICVVSDCIVTFLPFHQGRGQGFRKQLHSGHEAVALQA